MLITNALKRILITGPFASEYSIAKVNRNLALYMSKSAPAGYEVKLYANESFIDKLPSANELKRYPFLQQLTTTENLADDIILFYNFPKSIYAPYNLNKLQGSVKLAYLGWEESIYPDRLVKECNRELNGIAAISEHVRGVLRKSGIGLPMRVIHHGLDIPHAAIETYPIKSNKSFRIYHMSSGQYRKGLDVLVRSYLETFKKDDDVVLILKLFPNQSQDREAINLIQANQGAEIELINDGTISDGQMRYLAENSHLHVYPTRAEGFGLPIAEGLVAGKTVITTGYSGQMDFATKDNSFLLNYQLTPSRSHLNIPGSMVAEPDGTQLSKFLRFVYDNYQSDELQAKRLEAAKLKEVLTWEKAAEEMWEYVREMEQLAVLKQQSLQVVSTYNSQCGIAIYSGDLYPRIKNSFSEFGIYANSDVGERLQKDPQYLKRNWQYGELSFADLHQELTSKPPAILHIQYNLSFYSPLRLQELLELALSLNIKAYVTLHSVHHSLSITKNVFNKIKKVLVHSQRDKQELHALGITNVSVIAHGLPYYPDSDVSSLQEKLQLEGRQVIATHGMIHDKKGFVELLQAVALLKQDMPQILLLAITAVNPNNATSRHTYEKMLAVIKEKDLNDNVLIFPQFLENAVIVKLMQAAQVIILPYAQIKEGASGAVKYALASHRPIILTDSYIFTGLECGLKLKDNEPATLAQGIQLALSNPSLRSKMQQKAENYFKQYNWEELCFEHLKEYIS